MPYGCLNCIPSPLEKDKPLPLSACSVLFFYDLFSSYAVMGILFSHTYS